MKDKVACLCSIVQARGDTSFEMHDAAKKAIYHRENFSAFLEGRDFDVQPVTVEIVPSLDCNMHCPGCTYVQNQSKRKNLGTRRLMVQEVFDAILSGLKGLPQTKSIIFTGGGEPTMNPQLLKFMKQAKDESFEVGLYTNGSLLKPQDIRELIELEPVFVRVSLNAGTALTHSRMYGYNKKNRRIFKKVTGNIVTLAQAKKNLSSKTTVGIGIIINEMNYQDLDEMASLMLKLEQQAEGMIDYVAIRPEVYYFDQNLQVVTTQPNADIFAKIADQIEERVSSKVRPSGMKVLINRTGFELLAGDYQNTPNIANPWSASFDYDGRFYITSEHNGSPGFDLGDVKHESVRAIWQNNRRRKLMADMASGRIMTLPFFKLKTLNDMLLRIRALGIFSHDEVERFYRAYQFGYLPTHVNFI